MGDSSELKVAQSDALPNGAAIVAVEVEHKQSSPPEELTGLSFKDVCVDVSEKRILWSVSGEAKPGKVLALMGPSGSGKTTLLNCLAGHNQITSGSITLHGHRMSKRVRRQVSYVLQADIFFPNLTLRETLRYSALLRLPRELSFREKLARVEKIIELLRLQDCANTLIGSEVSRGLSGGEKKRANIGCELLTSPSLLLLDEPTSGLDSSSALNLMETLRHLAIDENKTIVMSIHQPSSQLFHMCDDLMLLAKGKLAYFGPTNKVVDYFADRGLHCTLHYNPADYILEAVTADETRKVLIGEDPKQETRPKKRRWMLCCHRHGDGEEGKVDLEKGESRREESEEKGEKEKEELSSVTFKTIDGLKIEEYASSPRLPGKGNFSALNPLSEVPLETNSSSETVEPSSESSSESGGDGGSRKAFKTRKWPTSWYWQFLVLLVRTFRQSRHVILSKLNLTQTLLLTIVSSFIWFQLPHHEDSIADRYGYLFFMIIYWGAQPLFTSTLSFPSEHAVIAKERRSGMYHLSAYYLAKSVSELPLVLLQPIFYLVITYWIVGLNGAAGFFGTLFIVITNALVAQGLGLLIGAVFMDFRRSIVAVAVILLTLMLLGGFYVKNLVFWIQWAEYLSFFTYSYDAMLYFEFTADNFFRCNEVSSSYTVCSMNSTMVAMGTNKTLSSSSLANGTGTELLIPGTDILRQLDVTLPFYAMYLALLGYGVLFRIAAYFALRYLHRDHK